MSEAAREEDEELFVGLFGAAPGGGVLAAPTSASASERRQQQEPLVGRGSELATAAAGDAAVDTAVDVDDDERAPPALPTPARPLLLLLLLLLLPPRPGPFSSPALPRGISSVVIVLVVVVVVGVGVLGERVSLFAADDHNGGETGLAAPQRRQKMLSARNTLPQTHRSSGGELLTEPPLLPEPPPLLPSLPENCRWRDGLSASRPRPLMDCSTDLSRPWCRHCPCRFPTAWTQWSLVCRDLGLSIGYPFDSLKCRGGK